MREWSNGRKKSIPTAKAAKGEKTREKEETRLCQVRKLAICEIEGKLAQTPRLRPQNAAED
jgi:hypothetical protein